ncbi:DMT family transporter [Oryzibacter oryziterrae]|uniref:DMT family transporter n=1 Tax=Oryzibacter oryziterrae TaxID=2766474 RepID=UPI001F31ABEB|nr:DMT family transporter [Oryzibacter oryziterrae]
MDDGRSGFLNGLTGVAIFSGSLPATRVAVQAFDPLFLTVARGSIAALLAISFLVVTRARRPTGPQFALLAVVSMGVVIGFPLLSALALRHVTSAHAMLFIGLLPLSTAAFAVLFGKERPQPAFWLFSLMGSALVGAYALRDGFSGSMVGDGAMLAAVVVCGLGYAEGARLSRELGGTEVISWALVLALPAMVPLALYFAPASLDVPASAWVGLAYVSVFSMFVGFLFWYRGLAQGGVGRVGQLQLLQPFMGLILAALLLGEQVGWAMVAVTAGVVLCVAGARRFAA